VAVAGDSTGLHVLAASEASGYAWRTVATLGDPAAQTDLWIGQACVTASGAYAVVVYAPEQVANMAEAQGELARAAIVNLHTDAVKDLGGGFSIAYFDPGCGTGSQAVLTKGGWANDTSNAAMSTTLVLADAATGRASATVKVPGQVTSAIPYGGQIAAAGGEGLEQISTSGKTRLLAATATVPFRLTPAADGSLGYQTMASRAAEAQTAGSPSTPVSDDRTCAIPIDDPQIQAYQPTFQQVEWAADQAVQGTLTDQRPSGLYGSSLSAYTPQGPAGLFPPPNIEDGAGLPAQVLLGGADRGVESAAGQRARDPGADR
jgi:hypothetical protein